MVRNLPPCAVPSWMRKLKNGAYMSNKLLERCLITFMNHDEATKVVDDAIKLGILVPKEKILRSKDKGISLCFNQTLDKNENSLLNDPYCFECHLPGTEPVMKCLLCVRSFHTNCQRKNPHRPNYSVPSDKGQPHRFPLNESDVEELSHEEVVQIDTRNTAAIEQNAPYELDFNSNINVVSKNGFKHEADSSDDVLFVSEQPARQRKSCNGSTYVKSEDASNNEMNELELCTPCRLRNVADLLNPPHMSIEELNCLLGYSWKKHHSWMKKDVRKYMSKHWNKRDSALVKTALFCNNILGLSDIARHIETQKFQHLYEFLIDLLDLQHNIGVFFGTKCEEYNATKWLLRDITHDIREISRCSDCYRHSNESNRSAFWFAKPCTQRHELVYAKQHGSPHWPAKVIRVMTKKSSIYDVRFFGGTHSRALISARDILPIDADISQTKIKPSRTFNAAMRELNCHKILLHQPMYLFNFYADPREAENLISRALPHCMEAAEVNASIKRPRAATPASAKKRKTIASVGVGVTTRKLTQRLHPLQQDTLQNLSTSSSPTFEAQATIASYQELMHEVFTLNEQLNRNKADLEMMREELKTVKRKRWCYNCLEEAEFDCCFSASYCSDACKRRDKRRHQSSCGLLSKT